jgi:hypothetical protein
MGDGGKTMKVTYTIKPKELDEQFLHVVQETFKNTGRKLEITVQSVGKPEGMDTTEWLLSDEDTRRIMAKGLAAAKTGKPYKTVTMEELEALAV